MSVLCKANFRALEWSRAPQHLAVSDNQGALELIERFRKSGLLYETF
jgi:hypothetical protein